MKAVAQNRLEKLVNSQPQIKSSIRDGDYLFYWLDKHRWYRNGSCGRNLQNLVQFVHGEETFSNASVTDRIDVSQNDFTLENFPSQSSLAIDPSIGN